MHTFIEAHLPTHLTRSAELRTAARDWRLAREARTARAGLARAEDAAAAASPAHRLRHRLGMALVHAGTRLAHPASAA
ncbi:hypothetical protein [Streptomyces sp. NRRL S-87]|uniref:hypothetical protein n=1 Tax=Streptomyces sp. NRRL S-87 TaxID=1463920 RepID=UPI0004C15368|nr:hypothetical protein [Streptomyces sp. NRRL S-87]